MPAPEVPVFCSFKELIYNVGCKHCRQAVRIRARRLAREEYIKCTHCRNSFRATRHQAIVEPGQKVRYRRLAEIFSCEGRIGVGEYWIGVLLFGIPLLPLAVFEKKSDGGIGMTMLIFSLLMIPLAVKRLHDLGMSGHLYWFIVLGHALAGSLGSKREVTASDLAFYAVFGLVVLGFRILISFVPGGKANNKYGLGASSVTKSWF
jgi:uncharacterized membrane protein YhaH (DUF805 family)